MISANTTLINTRVDSQQNKLYSSRSGRSSSSESNFPGRHMAVAPRHQNSSIFFLILQLIVQLLRQLQYEQEPETEEEETLDLDQNEKEAIQKRFGLFGEQGLSVIDKDGNDELSTGDIVSISGGVAGGHIRDIVLTQADVDSITGKDLADAKAELQKNREKWAHSRPENYTYTLQRSGFLPPGERKPIDITVKGDSVTDARFSDGSKALVPNYSRLRIDDLFNRIEKAIDSGAAEVKVKYDAKTGMPTSIFIDQDKRIADEEVYLNASNLRTLPVKESPRVKLSAAQNQNLQALFGYKPTDEKSIFVLDHDGNGKVSVGDEALVFDNRADPKPGDDGVIARKTLTASDVDKINSNNGTE